MAQDTLISGDHEFDVKVARFLETEFFASTDDYITAAVSSSKPSATASSVFSTEDDDTVFMDIMDFFEITDLESPTKCDFEVSTEHPAQLPSLPSIVTIEALQPTSSLHVLIPVRALVATPTRRRTPVTTTAPPPPKVKKSRKRVKDELEDLRQQVVDFKDRLEELKKHGSIGQQVTSYISAIPSSSSSLTFRAGQFTQTTQSASWKRVAKRQESEKRKSAAENLKLREMLKNQLQLAQSLSKLLENQQGIVWLESLLTGHGTSKLCITTESDDTEFKILTTRVETLSSDLDSVLVESDQVGLEPGVKSDATGNAYIEFVDRSALPFASNTAAAAIWKLLSTSMLSFGKRH